MSLLPKHTATRKNNTHKLLTKPLEIVGAAIFLRNNKTLLCIVDYYSKFPIMKRAEELSAII